MTIREAEPGTWSRRRWWGAIAAAVGIQLGLVVWLGDRSQEAPRKGLDEPQVMWLPQLLSDLEDPNNPANVVGDLADLDNPMLFSQASRHGFSGAAWLDARPAEYTNAPWSEPPRFLDLPEGQLGSLVHELVQAGMPAPVQVARKVEPAIRRSAWPELPSALPVKSEVRVEGDLAGRALVSRFALESQPHSDLLTNSVVRVVVDAEGRTQSATLLTPGSGLPEADQQALSFARAARFESLLGKGPERRSRKIPALTLGRLVFSWHTIPLPDTNAPAARP